MVLRNCISFVHVAAVGAAFMSVAAVGAPPSADYRLAWEEEFSIPKHYATNWAYRALGWRQADALSNTRDSVRLDIQEGTLHLHSTIGTPNKAGMVSTEGKRTFFRGYFEARISLPRKFGHKVAFWLRSSRYGKSGPPETHGAEIDVLEYLAGVPTAAYFHVHTFGYGEHQKTIGYRANGVVCAGCTHTFGLEWTSEEYTFFVDGKPYWRTTEGLSGVPLFLILSSHVVRDRHPLVEGDMDTARIHYIRHYVKH